MNRTIKLLTSIGMLSVLTFNPSLIKKVDSTTNGIELRDVLAETFTNEATGRKVTPKRAADAAALNITEAGVQQRKNDDGSYSMRVLAGITSLEADRAEFAISIGEKNTVAKISKAYSAAIINGEEKSATELFGTDYLVAYVVSGLDYAATKLTYSVTPSIYETAEAAPISAPKKDFNLINYIRDDAPAVALDTSKVSINVYNGFYMQIKFTRDSYEGEFDYDTAYGTISCNANSTKFDHWQNAEDGMIGLVSHGVNIESGTFDVHLEFLNNAGTKYVIEFRVADKKMVTIASAKTTAIAELTNYPTSMNYVEVLYSTTNWESIQNAIATGIENINAATTYDGIDAALAAAKQEIDSVEQDAVSIDAIKVAAIAKLDAYFATLNEGDYTSESWAAILQIKANAVTAINALTDVATAETEANSIIENAKALAAAVPLNIKIERISVASIKPHGGNYFQVFFNFAAGVDINSFDSTTCEIIADSQTYTTNVHTKGGDMAIWHVHGFNVEETAYHATIKLAKGTTVYVAELDVNNKKMTQTN